jgi:hypothetical protein
MKHRFLHMFPAEELTYNVYNRFGAVVPPPMPPSVISPPVFGVSLRSQRSSLSSTSPPDASKTPPSAPVKKTKKTVKLFWKEVRDDPIILAKLQQTGMIWDELNPVSVDTQKLEHLFESRAKDLITKVCTLILPCLLHICICIVISR